MLPVELMEEEDKKAPRSFMRNGCNCPTTIPQSGSGERYAKADFEFYFPVQ